ncbi:MAG TPA: pyruvate kinase [Candidatus Caccenecus avistercoris]|nr:pyruvate kinase [Candidatus Caccenecus avistercoris]
MKKTKIICSIGPATNTKEVFKELVHAGMNVARVNFSHATIEERETVRDLVAWINEEENANIGLLYDTKGPEFRNGEVVEGGINLVPGNTIRVVKESVIGNDERFSVNHPEALDSLNVGSVIQLENGLMKIEVISKETDGVTCKVINGGNLGSKKSLFVPGVKLDIPFISDVDREDIIYACKNNGDFLALSFVSTKEDVLEAREILKEQNSNMKIIAKIESKTGIDNLDEILEVSDGVMVARGDLGEEVPISLLPVYQKRIVRKAREHGKFCIVATEMLESMKKNSRPTRAEVTDVANAVLDGTDAVMLSGETTVGAYPVETVTYMASIASDAEVHSENHFGYLGKIGRTECIAKSAVDLTNYVDVKAIVAEAISGYSTRMISNFRPKCPILATCTTPEVARSLALNYGVYTTLVPLMDDTDELVDLVRDKAIEYFDLKNDDKIIITGGLPAINDVRLTNFLKIEEINK